MSVKEFAEEYIKAEYEAWHEGAFDSLQRLEQPDVAYRLIAIGQETVGWEAHKQYIQGVRQLAPGIRIQWEYLTGDGNIFAMLFKTSGARFTRQMPGWPPPTGKEITVNSLFVFRLKDGKIAEVWSNGTITGLT